MSEIYSLILDYAKRYPWTIAWRKKAHAKVIDKHLNPEEKVIYAFCCQKGFSSFDIFNTYAVAITNKRVIIAQKRVLFGYLFLAITPDMFNDLTIKTGIVWGKACLDTVKEVVILSNLSKASVDEIETVVTEYMMREKKKYVKVERGEQ
jgi:hypothetical protein